MADDLQQLIIDWQSQHAFLQADVETLNTVVLQQQQQIAQLEQNIAVLQQKLAAVLAQQSHDGAVEPFDPDKERPPHY